MSIPTSDSFSVPGAPTANFNVLNISPSQAREAAYSVRHVPHGNYNIVQTGGRKHAERHFTVYVPDESELNNLDACLGLIGGSLTYHKGTFVAFLAKYDARMWYFSDQQTVDLTLVTDAD